VGHRARPEGEFRVTARQSDAGQALFARHGLPTDDDTFMLVDGGEYCRKSTAALPVLRRLGLPYSVSYPAILVPRVVRDRVEDFVADPRYGWFGRLESCMLRARSVRHAFSSSAPAAVRRV